MKKYLALLLAVMMIVTACYTGFVVSAAEVCEHAQASILPMIDGKLTDAANPTAAVKPTEFTQGMEPVYTFAYQNLRYCTECGTYIDPTPIDGDIEYNYYIYFDNQVADNGTNFTGTASAHFASSDKYTWDEDTSAWEEVYTTEYHGTGTWDGSTPITVNLKEELKKGSNAWDNIINVDGYAGAIYIHFVMENDATRTANVIAGVAPTSEKRNLYQGAVVFNIDDIDSTALTEAATWDEEMALLKDRLGEIGTVNLVDAAEFLPDGSYTYTNIKNNEATARADLTADIEVYRDYWKAQQGDDKTTIAIVESTIAHPDTFKVYEVYVEAGGSDLKNVDFTAEDYVDDGKYLPVVGYLTVPVENDVAKTGLNLEVYYQGYGYYNPTPKEAAGNFDDTETLEFRINNMGYPLNLDENILLWMQNHQAGCLNADKEFDTELNKSFDTSYYNAVIRRGLRAVQYVKYYALNNGILEDGAAQLSNVTTTGGSFGGFQAIAVAGLDNTVTTVNATYPWMCNVGGRYFGAAGSSFMPGTTTLVDTTSEYASLNAFKYFDSTFFAKRINKDALVKIDAIGLGDSLCTVYGIAALHNTLKAAGISVTAEYVQDGVHGERFTNFTSGVGPYGLTKLNSTQTHSAYFKDDRTLRNQNIVQYFDINGIEQTVYGDNGEKNRLTFNTSAATDLLATTLFSENTTIDSVIVKAPTENLGNSSLKNDYYLEEFKFEGEGFVKKVGVSAFEADWKLAALEFPYGLEYVSDWALQYCGIKSLKLPVAGPKDGALKLGHGSLNVFAPDDNGWERYSKSITIDDNGKGGLEIVEFTYDPTKTYGTLDTTSVGNYKSRILSYTSAFQIDTDIIVDESAPTASDIASWWIGNTLGHVVLDVNPDAIITFVENGEDGEGNKTYTMVFGKGVKTVSYDRVVKAADDFGLQKISRVNLSTDTSEMVTSYPVTKLQVYDTVHLEDADSKIHFGEAGGVFNQFKFIENVEWMTDYAGFNYIGVNAFNGNQGLKKLTLPNVGLTFIGNSALRKMPLLEELVIEPVAKTGLTVQNYVFCEQGWFNNGATTKNTGTKAVEIHFNEDNLTTTYAHQDTTTDTIMAWGNTQGYKIYVDFGTKAYTDLLSLRAAPTTTRVYSNTAIKFDAATGVMTLSASVTDINMNDIATATNNNKTALTEVVIKGKVNLNNYGHTINAQNWDSYGTFAGCTNLSKITFDGEGACIVSCGDAAFNNLDNITELVFPVGLTYFGAQNLQNGRVRRIVFPEASKDSETGAIIPIEFGSISMAYAEAGELGAYLGIVEFKGTDANTYKFAEGASGVGISTNTMIFYKDLNALEATFRSGCGLADDSTTKVTDANRNPKVYVNPVDKQLIAYNADDTSALEVTNTDISNAIKTVGYSTTNLTFCPIGNISLGDEATNGFAINDINYNHTEVNKLTGISKTGGYFSYAGSKAFVDYKGTKLVLAEGLTSTGAYFIGQNIIVEELELPASLKTISNLATNDRGALNLKKITWNIDSAEGITVPTIISYAASNNTVNFHVKNLSVYNAVAAVRNAQSTGDLWKGMKFYNIDSSICFDDFTYSDTAVTGYNGTATEISLPEGVTAITSLGDKVLTVIVENNVTIADKAIANGSTVKTYNANENAVAFAKKIANKVYLHLLDEDLSFVKEGDYNFDGKVNITDRARFKKHFATEGAEAGQTTLLRQAGKGCYENGVLNPTTAYSALATAITNYYLSLVA